MRFISIADLGTRPTPEHVPEAIGAAFQEGAKCRAVGCFNAAAAMFRLCLDLATKEKFRDDSAMIKRPLAARLKELFDTNKLPADLEPLTGALKDDGNDAVHDGTLGKAEADDLIELATILLKRWFEEFGTTARAVARREARGKAETPAQGRATSSGS